MIYDVNEARAGARPAERVQAAVETRRTDLMMHVAYASVSAIIVSLLWILSGSTTPLIKAWSAVIGLSLTAAILAGRAMVETARIRRRLAAQEAMIASMAQTVAAQALAAQAVQAAAAGENKRQPGDHHSRRRPGRRRSRRTAGDAGQIISDEFQIFLRGRESRFEDGPDPL
ncbi:MAG: hypothetical protein HOV66_07100 [Streptomycetaceae bacterium]|nr:hypothetical protein [Streptomycetaceae bacterium]